MADKLGYGLLGCGTVAPWHINGILETSEADLVAVCDTDPDKARRRQEESGAAKIYTDHREMLEDPDIHAVSVCVPSGLHTRLGMDVIRAGRHILVEKPLDITLPKIDAFIQAARQMNVKLGCIFQRRTTPVWQAVKHAIDAGVIGRLLVVDAYLKYHRNQEYYDSAPWRGTWAMDGGGALMNQGIHIVDILQWVVGPPRNVFARCDHLVRNIEVEDTAAAVVTWRCGAIGVIEGTTSIYKGIDHRIEFHGEKGNILIEGDGIARWENADNVPCPEGLSGGASGTASDPTSISFEGHRIQIEDFTRAVLEDRPPMIGGEEARKAVELIVGIYRSSELGQPVEFPLAE